MAKNKGGVKKTRANSASYIEQKQQEQLMHDFIIRKHTRQFCLDMFTIAMGRMGYGEKRMRDLEKTVSEVFIEYTKLIEDDTPDIEYTKAVMDRELKR